MATLTTQQINEVYAELASKYSAIWLEVPVTKSQFKTWLADTVDVQMESAETAVFTNTPAGAAKDWLAANPDIGRDVMVAIEAKRREVL